MGGGGGAGGAGARGAGQGSFSGRPRHPTKTPFFFDPDPAWSSLLPPASQADVNSENGVVDNKFYVTLVRERRWDREAQWFSIV